MTKDKTELHKEHTPLPWRSDGCHIWANDVYIAFAENDVNNLLNGGNESPSPAIARANANLIVTAVNSYHKDQEAIKELCEGLLPFANYACSEPGTCKCHNCIARDLISKHQPSQETQQQGDN